MSPEDQEMQLACILDLSLKGIGMQLLRPINPGRVVMISMKSNDGARVYELSARVMHSNALPHDEWYIGCELINELTAEELDHLL